MMMMILFYYSMVLVNGSEVKLTLHLCIDPWIADCRYLL
jgi:hypothetical protein